MITDYFKTAANVLLASVFILSSCQKEDTPAETEHGNITMSIRADALTEISAWTKSYASESVENKLVYAALGIYDSYGRLIYSDKVGKNLMNSLKLYFRSVFITFLFCLLCYSLVLIRYIPSILKYFLVAIVIVLVLPIFLLMFYEYEIHIFDKYINSYQYPHFVKKGLYIEKENQTVDLKDNENGNISE